MNIWDPVSGATVPQPGNGPYMMNFQAGAPTNGTSGSFAGLAPPGALLGDTTNKKLYQNTGTLLSPTWTLFETSAAAIGASSQTTVAGPSTPNSTSAFTMQGLAGSITPTKSGTIHVTISGTVTGTSTAAGDGLQYQVSHGTGTAPTANAALAGTQDGAVQEYLNPTTVTAADVQIPFCTSALITGLAVGTAYWLDLAAKAIAHTLTGLSNVNIVAIEI